MISGLVSSRGVGTVVPSARSSDGEFAGAPKSGVPNVEETGSLNGNSGRYAASGIVKRTCTICMCCLRLLGQDKGIVSA